MTPRRTLSSDPVGREDRTPLAAGAPSIEVSESPRAETELRTLAPGAPTSQREFVIDRSVLVVVPTGQHGEEFEQKRIEKVGPLQARQMRRAFDHHPKGVFQILGKVL